MKRPIISEEKNIRKEVDNQIDLNENEHVRNGVFFSNRN